MMKLDNFIGMMTGYFDNKEQFNMMQATGKIYPYAIRTGLTVLYAYLCLYCNYFIFIFQIMPFVFLQKLV